MKLEDLPKVEQKALEMYRQYANAWARDAGDDAYQVAIENFFTYDETYHIGYVDTGWYGIWVMSAGTGDDGGPAKLTVWSPAPGYPTYTQDDPYIQAIVHDFDTMVGQIYDAEEGGWIKWPESIPKP